MLIKAFNQAVYQYDGVVCKHLMALVHIYINIYCVELTIQSLKCRFEHGSFIVTHERYVIMNKYKSEL